MCVPKKLSCIQNIKYGQPNGMWNFLTTGNLSQCQHCHLNIKDITEGYIF